MERFHALISNYPFDVLFIPIVLGPWLDAQRGVTSLASFDCYLLYEK